MNMIPPMLQRFDEEKFKAPMIDSRFVGNAFFASGRNGDFWKMQGINVLDMNEIVIKTIANVPSGYKLSFMQPKFGDEVVLMTELKNLRGINPYIYENYGKVLEVKFPAQYLNNTYTMISVNKNKYGCGNAYYDLTLRLICEEDELYKGALIDRKLTEKWTTTKYKNESVLPYVSYAIDSTNNPNGTFISTGLVNTSGNFTGGMIGLGAINNQFLQPKSLFNNFYKGNFAVFDNFLADLGFARLGNLSLADYASQYLSPKLVNQKFTLTDDYNENITAEEVKNYFSKEHLTTISSCNDRVMNPALNDLGFLWFGDKNNRQPFFDENGYIDLGAKYISTSSYCAITKGGGYVNRTPVKGLNTLISDFFLSPTSNSGYINCYICDFIPQKFGALTYLLRLYNATLNKKFGLIVGVGLDINESVTFLNIEHWFGFNAFLKDKVIKKTDRSYLLDLSSFKTSTITSNGTKFWVIYTFDYEDSWFI